MSLPQDWVNSIFDKLTLVYGQVFLRRWQDLDLEKVKADWAHELAALERSPKSISYALQNLPAEKPPTVLEFRKIAWAMPAADVPRIDHVAASPAIVSAALAVISTKPLNDSKQWARQIIARAANGDKIRPYTLNCARQALGMADQNQGIAA